MSLSRKHFNKTAEILRLFKDSQSHGEIVQEFAMWFASENPSFDCERFLEASGYMQSPFARMQSPSARL